MIGSIVRSSSHLVSGLRSFSSTAGRAGGHGVPPPGDNLPFSINNRFKLTAYFILFFGSGLTVPFYAMRHQLLKK
ncbi:cytochrome c oxidase subunit 7C, mitochondrial [Eurytemora carolleeae]|uniref:cytochrome c oxidase subunit 7C, mitochondrial n=1 Tax=Eurytemora carolleeae TaxID=1294199 RepID=UPI000C75CF29|nr:cytochrome c oxidase subunit 7C, mitochondrial [Eurytemora carolleeae]|eukprot:XP_023341497.1 cytochrome c oxidase subunit 7C, mitochondrial-like [Eurytemora affinis]